ncbi:MAG: hypothetical protein DWQ36_00775 [Acidobacteria bacterium]|nr:MAG: hypothetical protein DWQ30_09060 [Acidobacteriota bacterium]REK11791.1 MAG: hypothetical protein DWQ36_00775 [Acidobacteriota bacterium]
MRQLFALAIALLPCAVVQAQPEAADLPAAGTEAVASSVEQQREQRRRELDLAVARLEQRLERTEEQRDDLLGRAGVARARARLQRERLARVQLALAAGEDAVAAGRQEIAELELRIDRARRRLGHSARSLYRLGRFAYLRLLFSLGERVEPLPALRQLRYLTQRDAASLRSYRELEATLQARQVTLAQERVRLAQLLETERDEAARLRVEERRLAGLVEQLEARRREIAAQVASQRERSERLALLMETLAGEGSSGLQDDPIQRFRGGLDWPVDGRVTQSFGSRRDPKYGTVVPHNGLELSVATAATGVPVRSVYPGRVIFAAPFQDLGFTVVVQHEEAVLTLYSGLAELSVAEGDVLLLQDVVGTISDRLYFEIRHRRRPEDPAEWLR